MELSFAMPLANSWQRQNQCRKEAHRENEAMHEKKCENDVDRDRYCCEHR
jgi:hypothetical protein